MHMKSYTIFCSWLWACQAVRASKYKYINVLICAHYGYVQSVYGAWDGYTIITDNIIWSKMWWDETRPNAIWFGHLAFTHILCVYSVQKRRNRRGLDRTNNKSFIKCIYMRSLPQNVFSFCSFSYTCIEYISKYPKYFGYLQSTQMRISKSILMGVFVTCAHADVSKA